MEQESVALAELLNVWNGKEGVKDDPKVWGLTSWKAGGTINLAGED